MLINNREIKLIFGLGNPGTRFLQTRHNVGRMLVEFLAQQNNIEFAHKKDYALAESTDILLAYPIKEYMNDVGKTLAQTLKDLRPADAGKLTTCDLMVVHDDLETIPGKFKFKESGSAGGHNGLKSIIEHLGTDEFLRLKIGIGRPESRDEDEVAKYVLEKNNSEEQKKILEVFHGVSSLFFS